MNLFLLIESCSFFTLTGFFFTCHNYFVCINGCMCIKFSQNDFGKYNYFECIKSLFPFIAKLGPQSLNKANSIRVLTSIKGGA